MPYHSQPRHHHLYIIHLINCLQRFYRITMLKKTIWFTTTTYKASIGLIIGEIYFIIDENCIIVHVGIICLIVVQNVRCDLCYTWQNRWCICFNLNNQCEVLRFDMAYFVLVLSSSFTFYALIQHKVFGLVHHFHMLSLSPTWMEPISCMYVDHVASSPLGVTRGQHR